MNIAAWVIAIILAYWGCTFLMDCGKRLDPRIAVRHAAQEARTLTPHDNTTDSSATSPTEQPDH